MTSRPVYVVELAAVGVIMALRHEQSQTTGDKGIRAAFSYGLLLLVTAAIGEASPAIATGFATLVLVAVLLSPRTDLAGLLKLPDKFLKQ